MLSAIAMLNSNPTHILAYNLDKRIQFGRALVNTKSVCKGKSEREIEREGENGIEGEGERESEKARDRQKETNRERERERDRKGVKQKQALEH